MSIIPSAAPNNTNPSALTPSREHEIRTKLAWAARDFGGIDYVSPTFGLLRDTLAELDRLRSEQATRVVQLENALAATGRSLSSFIFDSDDPGTDALGAQWLYGQAMPHADDSFAQPRAFRSSVFSEASKAVEELDGHTPDDHRERPQSYLDGYSDGLQDAAESLEKLADQAAEGSEVTS